MHLKVISTLFLALKLKSAYEAPTEYDTIRGFHTA